MDVIINTNRNTSMRYRFDKIVAREQLWKHFNSVMDTSARAQFDDGYAWIVLGATSLMRGLVDGFWATLGIMMLQWQEHFDISTSQTAWIGSLFFMLIFCACKCFVYCITALIVNKIKPKRY